MAHRVLTEIAVSITDHKKNPMATVAAGKGMAVAVLNHNEPAFYCVPPKAYEDLMDLVDDLELDRLSESGFALQAPTRIVGLFQCWPHPEGSRGLLHSHIEAGQPGAAAVQRYDQMQGVTGP